MVESNYKWFSAEKTLHPEVCGMPNPYNYRRHCSRHHTAPSSLLGVMRCYYEASPRYSGTLDNQCSCYMGALYRSVRRQGTTESLAMPDKNRSHQMGYSEKYVVLAQR